MKTPSKAKHERVARTVNLGTQHTNASREQKPRRTVTSRITVNRLYFTCFNVSHYSVWERNKESVGFPVCMLPLTTGAETCLGRIRTLLSGKSCFGAGNTGAIHALLFVICN